MSVFLFSVVTGTKAHAYASVSNIQAHPSGGVHRPQGGVTYKGQCTVTTPNNKYEVHQTLVLYQGNTMVDNTFGNYSVAPNSTNLALNVEKSIGLVAGTYNIQYAVSSRIADVDGGGEFSSVIAPGPNDDYTFQVDGTMFIGE